MNALLFILPSALFLQFSRGDLADDAKTVLNSLRSATRDNLNGGFLEHTKMAVEIDKVSLNTKRTGHVAIQKKTEELLQHLNTNCQEKLVQWSQRASDAVEDCVSSLAAEITDSIFTKSSMLINMTLFEIHEEDKAIILCGRLDDECLNSVIQDVNAKIDVLPNRIYDEIEDDRQKVIKYLDMIEDCLNVAVRTVDNFVKDITCQ